jgi:hypothetical protein
LQSIAVAGVTILLTLPWWLTILNHHGLAPYQTALSAHPRNLAFSLLYLFQFNLTGETLLAIIAVLGLIGVVRAFRSRQFLLPAWIGLAFMSDPRAAPFASLVPLIFLAVDGFETTLTAPGLTSQIENGFASRTARGVLFSLIAYLLMSAMIMSMWIGNEYRILPEERQAFRWIMENTPKESRFLILTGNAALSDPVSEWFPALTSRTSIVTVQGHEWTPDSPLRINLQSYHDAQSCLHTSPGCLASWEFDYLYIRKIQPQKDGSIQTQSFFLEASLLSSQEYRLVYESETTLIFAATNLQEKQQ